MTSSNEKIINISSLEDIQTHKSELNRTACSTSIKLGDILKSASANEFLYRVKFEPIGCDPLKHDRQLNLIEQVNQHFTYLASLRAAELWLNWHPKAIPFTLNLGTTSGFDIESSGEGGIVAEVFSAVNPTNNGKLNKDVKKISGTQAKHKYVFYLCPGEDTESEQPNYNYPNVKIWALASKDTLTYSTSMLSPKL